MGALPGIGVSPASGGGGLPIGTFRGEIPVTDATFVFKPSPAPNTVPAAYPTFMLAGDPTTPAVPVVIVQGAAGQAGNLFETRLANGTLACYVDAAGLPHGFAAGGTITGAGTAGTITVWDGLSSVTNSELTDNGTSMVQTPAAATSGSPVAWTLKGAVHTTLAAGVETRDVSYDLNRTVQFATGALATQRAFLIAAPTYAFAGASVVGNAATLAISGAPIAGAHATLTNSHALWVQSGAASFGTGGVAVGVTKWFNATNTKILTIQAGVTSTSYTLTLPVAQGGANTFLRNNGSGALSWAAGGGASGSGTVNVLAKVTNATGPVYGDSNILDTGTQIQLTAPPLVVDTSADVIWQSSGAKHFALQGSTLNNLPTYGAEFLSGTGWTSTGWTGSWAAGWTHTAGNVTVLSQSTAAAIGTRYQITYTITPGTGGTITIGFGGHSIALVAVTGAYGPTATTTDGLTVTPTSDFDGTLVISIQSIPTGASSLFTLRDSSGAIKNECRLGVNAVFIGVNAGKFNTTGVDNVAVGYQALEYNTTGNSNTAIGMEALYLDTIGSGNTAIGRYALYTNTTGNSNSALGVGALFYNTTGFSNEALGMYALHDNTIGSSNVALGIDTMYSNTEGSNNTAVGRNTGFKPAGVQANATTTASYQTLVGGDAGQGSAAQSDYITCVGFNAVADGANAMALGANAVAFGANTISIGDGKIVATSLKGVLYIGQGTADALRVDPCGRIYGNAVANPTAHGTDAAVRLTNVVTITCTAAHNLCAGQTVTLAGFTMTTNQCNGTFLITSVPTTTTFTVASAGANETSITTTGTITVAAQIVFGALPVTAYADADVLIQSTADTQIPLVVQAHSGTQSANLQEWQASTGGYVATVDASGLGSFNSLKVLIGDLTYDSTASKMMWYDGGVSYDLSLTRAAAGELGVGDAGTSDAIRISASGCISGNAVANPTPHATAANHTTNGTWIQITIAAGAPHNLCVGQIITLAGWVWNAGGGVVNGTWSVTATPTAGTFQVQPTICPTTGSNPGTVGTVTVVAKVDHLDVGQLTENVNVLGNCTGNQTIDLALGNVVTATLTGPGIWTFSNVAPLGKSSTVFFRLTNAGTNITWSPVPKWSGGIPPTMTASGVDLLVFNTVDGGTTWDAVVSSLDSK